MLKIMDTKSVFLCPRDKKKFCLWKIYLVAHGSVFSGPKKTALMEMKSIDVSVWSWDGTSRTEFRKM